MDTSISLPMFMGEIGTKTLKQLLESGFPEDTQLAQQVRGAVFLCVDTLNPLLRYVAQPVLLLADDEHYSHDSARARRAIDLARRDRDDEEWHVFLDEDGRFFRGLRCGHSMAPRHFHEVQVGERAWEKLPVGELFTGLRDAFTEAQTRREKHLASITQARQTLEAMVQLLEAPITEPSR